MIVYKSYLYTPPLLVVVFVVVENIPDVV